MDKRARGKSKDFTNRPTMVKVREYPSIGAQLLQGEALSQLLEIPSNSVQLIITSPPYNIGKEYEKKVSYEKYLGEMSPIINELVRILKPGGSICWQVGNGVSKGEVFPLDALFYPIFKSLGLSLRNRIVWTFGHGLHAQKRFSGRHETILWFTKGEDYVFNLDSVRVPSKYPNKKHYKGPNRGRLSGNPLGKNPGDVWEITNVKALHPEKTEHPCQFPVALVDRLVKALSNPNDIVLDPYVGSGTTIIASALNGRRSIGIDISKKYFSIADNRIKTLINGNLKYVTILKNQDSRNSSRRKEYKLARRAN